jgi:hypothetical protein
VDDRLDVPEEEAVDVRCPAGFLRADGTCTPGRLLFKIRQRGEKPSYVHPDNHIELYCDACTRKLRKAGRNVKRVLHRYDFIGTLMETLIVEEV